MNQPDIAERFRTLQARLPDLWQAIRNTPERSITSVVIPSLSVDQEELQKVDGAAFYEERLLFSLIRLRNPFARVLYVSSLPVHGEIVEYYLHLLFGVPSSHARQRLGFLSVNDTSPQPLTAKLLARPRAIERIRRWIGNPDDAYLTCFASTELERELALRIGIPLNAVDPALLYWGTKSGSREAFREAGVSLPAGFENLHGREAVANALVQLEQDRPGLAQAMIKLNQSFSGEGNAVFRYPSPTGKKQRLREVDRAIDHLLYAAPDQRTEDYFRKIESMGGIVEERLVGDTVRSPSVQLRISPDREIQVVSTHEQVLGGDTGQVFIGCRFPADEEYRMELSREAVKIGEVLRDRGVISRFGVDFLAVRTPDGAWSLSAIEINLRMGGTTHPFLALEFLTGGELDQQSGLFRSPRGEYKYYFATDNLKSESYRGLLPEDLMDILVHRGLQYRASTETGVLFHMIGALSQYGKVGVTCIGNSIEEADNLYQETVSVLDHETGATGEEGGRSQGLLDRRLPTME